MTGPLKVIFFLETNRRSRQAIEVVKAFAAAGADLTYVTMLARSDLHEAVEEEGIPTHALGVNSKRDFPGATARLAKIVGEVGPDVVHSVEPVPATLGALAALKARRGLRIFHRQHSVARWPQSAFAWSASRLSNLVIACSDAAGVMARREGVPSSKMRVVHNGAPAPRPVPVEEIAEVRRRLGITQDAAVIASVARLRSEKGVQVAIEALPLVAREVTAPVHYVVAGDGPFRNDLEVLASRNRQAVHFVGHQHDVAPWLAIADVVAMPSFYDALPVAGAEAMAAGKPIVASATGGLTELVVDGKTGLLTPPGDARQLAAALSRLLAEPETRRAFGEAAHERFASRFSVERMAEGCMAVYGGALGEL